MKSLSSIPVPLNQMMKDHWILGVGLFALQFIVYNFFFSSLVLTDHTLRAAVVQDYPSFRTLQEGRWLQDIIVLMLGSTGVHTFMMFAAAALQSFNAILLLDLSRVTKKLDVVLLGAIFCLYPAFLDYYGFGIDHVSFALGDTFILLGCWAFINLSSSWQRVVLPALAYTCALAIYQPKLALVCSVIIIGLTSTWVNRCNGADTSLISYAKDIGLAVLGLFTALVLYGASLTMTVTTARPAFKKFNTPAEVLGATQQAIVNFAQHFAGGMGGLPPWISIVPILLVATGAATLTYVLWRRSRTIGVLTLALLVCFPLALGIAGMINPEAPIRAGRGSSAFAVVFVFLIAWAMKSIVPKQVVLFAVGLVAYCFLLFGAQRNASAEFKSLWEASFISRMTSQLESSVDLPAGRTKPLVVIGQFHYPHHARFVKHPSTHARSQAFYRAFAPYAQVPILNFFMGRNALRQPTSAEAALALQAASGRPVWPHKGSIYEHNGIVVIVLESPHGGVDTTMTAG